MVAWTYDYFASQLEGKKRQEFDNSIDAILYADEYRRQAKEERRAKARAMMSQRA